MIWTSKRGPSGTSQLWTASFDAPLDSPSAAPSTGRPSGSSGS